MTQNDTALHQAPARQQPWLPGIINKGIFFGEIIFRNSESICLILTTIIWIICLFGCICSSHYLHLMIRTLVGMFGTLMLFHPPIFPVP